MESPFGNGGAFLYISGMKIKPVWPALLVISSFLLIHAGYNHPTHSVFTGLLWIINNEGIYLAYDNLPLQFLLVAGFLISAALLERKKLVITGIILMILLLGIWYYLLSGSIEFDHLSMIPFLLSSFFGIFYLVKEIHKERMEKEEQK